MKNVRHVARILALVTTSGFLAATELAAQIPGLPQNPGQLPPRPLPTPIEAPVRTNDLRIVSLDPATGELRSFSLGETMTPENSIEVVLEYQLASHPDAVVSASLLAPGVRYTSSERSPNRVFDESGRVRKRLAIDCGPDTWEPIRNLQIQYRMFLPGGSPMLVEKTQALPHTVVCPRPEPTRPVARNEDALPPPGPEPTKPVARATDVVRPEAPAIDPGIAKRPSPSGIEPGIADRVGACPDPATVDLSARLVGRTDPSRGVGIVEIIGVVRNVGRAAYVSEPRQQRAELIEEQPGTAPRGVATQAFTNLAPNATRRLVHRRGWDTATEFQPRYRLRLVYEPDIRTDANPRNDDCGLDNNETVLEPARINALFR